MASWTRSEPVFGFAPAHVNPAPGGSNDAIGRRGDVGLHDFLVADPDGYLVWVTLPTS